MADGDIEIQGLAELEAALANFPKQLGEARLRAGRRIGLHCVREAKRNAPRSPTKKTHSKTLKRKRVTDRKDFFPGGLEKSIAFSVDPAIGDVSVFVAWNSYAAAYAKKIHDERFRTWLRRGPGTVAKGDRAREKFIERAVADNVGKYGRVIEQEIRREIASL